MSDTVCETYYCTPQKNMLISLHLVQYEFAKKKLKKFPPIDRIEKLLCEPVDKKYIIFKPFFMGNMLLYI